MAQLTRIAAIACALLLASAATADDQRARLNYMLNCQGCHLPGAVGHGDAVPRMSEFVGYFLHSQEGREFIVRVPGVATSAIADVELAELVNWLLVTFSREQLPADFVPYTAQEVARLRRDVEPDPVGRRVEVLAVIGEQVPALKRELTAHD